VLRGIQGHALRIFGDVIEHNRLGDAAAAVREAQFRVLIAQRLKFFREGRN